MASGNRVQLKGIDVESIYPIIGKNAVTHNPQVTFKASATPLPFYRMLPRLSYRASKERERQRKPGKYVDGEDLSYCVDPKYCGDSRIDVWRAKLMAMERDGSICPINKSTVISLSHPLVAGAALPHPSENQSGQVAVLTGLFSGACGPFSHRVPCAAVIVSWLLCGGVGVLYVIVHSKNKLVNSPPENVASLGFCCRQHLENFLKVFRRWELRCPLRGDGYQSMPTATFLVRSLNAFDTNLYELVGGDRNRGRKKSGVTVAESVLNRFIILTREALNKKTPRGFRIPSIWKISSEDQQPYHIPADGWIAERVLEDDFRAANTSHRCENDTWSMIHSLRDPKDIAACMQIY